VPTPAAGVAAVLHLAALGPTDVVRRPYRALLAPAQRMQPVLSNVHRMYMRSVIIHSLAAGVVSSDRPTPMPLTPVVCQPPQFLDLGCGDGRLVAAAAPFCQVRRRRSPLHPNALVARVQ
jgi:hypothetical protein